MAQTSEFWNGLSIGDAIQAPYEANTVFAEMLMDVLGTPASGAAGGVVQNQLNQLNPTVASQTVTIDTGHAWVYGTRYVNDTTLGTAIPIPSGSTRIDRLVLRKSWAAQTVRITRIAGVEGGIEPALVKIAGTTWDVPLCSASITTGGVVTLTDERAFVFAGQVPVTVPNGGTGATTLTNGGLVVAHGTGALTATADPSVNSLTVTGAVSAESFAVSGGEAIVPPGAASVLPSGTNIPSSGTWTVIGTISGLVAGGVYLCVASANFVSGISSGAKSLLLGIAPGSVAGTGVLTGPNTNGTDGVNPVVANTLVTLTGGATTITLQGWCSGGSGGVTPNTTQGGLVVTRVG